MAKKVMQFRYYSQIGENNSRNLNSTTDRGKLISGNLFADYLPIYQIGIQSLPGVKFYLNNAENPTIVGSTGIYELDLNGETQITSLSFAQESLAMIDDNDLGYLIIDILYEKEE